MVNSPTVGGEQMGDAGHDGNFCNIAPACLPDFIHTLRAMLQCKPVLLADVALANGADTELMKPSHKRTFLQNSPPIQAGTLRQMLLEHALPTE